MLHLRKALSLEEDILPLLPPSNSPPSQYQETEPVSFFLFSSSFLPTFFPSIPFPSHPLPSSPFLLIFPTGQWGKPRWGWLPLFLREFPGTTSAACCKEELWGFEKEFEGDRPGEGRGYFGLLWWLFWRSCEALSFFLFCFLPSFFSFYSSYLLIFLSSLDVLILFLSDLDSLFSSLIFFWSSSSFLLIVQISSFSFSFSFNSKNDPEKKTFIDLIEIKTRTRVPLYTHTTTVNIVHASVNQDRNLLGIRIS